MPTTLPIHSSVQGQLTMYEIAQLAKKAGFSNAQLPTITALAWKNSDGKPAANGGLFGTSGSGNALDQAKQAYGAYQSNGFGAFPNYKNDAYQTYYNDAVYASTALTSGVKDAAIGIPAGFALATGVALGVPLLVGGAGAAAAEDAATGAEDAASGGSAAAASKASGYASTAVKDLSSLAGAGGLATLLVDPHFLFRMVEIVGGFILILMGLRWLANAGGANIPNPVSTAAKVAVR